MFDRIFAFLNFDGDVSVDDKDVFVHAKSAADSTDECGIVDFLEIGIFDFAVGFGIFQKVTFEGGHAGFAEERRVGVGPEPVVVVELTGDGVCALAVGFANHLFHLAKEVAAGEFLVANVGFAKAAVLVGRDAGVENEGVIAGEGHAALADDEAHVLPEAIAGNKGFAEAVEAGLFFVGEAVWINRIDGGEVGIVEGVDLPLQGDGAVGMVDEVKEASIFHLPFRVAGDDRARELEFENSGGLVHACEEVFVEEVGFTFGVEAGCGVVAVNGVGELGERGQKDAVAFFELPEAEVAE